MAPRVSKEEGRSKLGRGANCKERKEILTFPNIQGKTYDPAYELLGFWNWENGNTPYRTEDDRESENET